MRRAVARGLLALLVIVPVILAGCTSPESNTSGDADGDRVPDEVETKPWKITIRTLDGEETREVTSDPTTKDTDGDGLHDYDEFTRGSDPRSIDTDGDGLLDGKSIQAAANSDLGKKLAAAQILQDPEQPGSWLGELSLCPGGGGTHPSRVDSDLPLADGLADGDEIRGWDVKTAAGTVHVRSSPCSVDSDGDHLIDTKEREYGSDPGDADTDGDGVEDFADPDPAADLAITFTIERITAKTDALLGGHQLTFRVGVGSEEETIAVTVPSKGAHDVKKSVVVNVPDGAAASRTEFTIPVSVLATQNNAGQERGYAISSASPSNRADVTWDMIGKTWSLQGRSGSGSFTTEGNDAVVLIKIETTRL